MADGRPLPFTPHDINRMNFIDQRTDTSGGLSSLARSSTTNLQLAQQRSQVSYRNLYLTLPNMIYCQQNYGVEEWSEGKRRHPPATSTDCDFLPADADEDDELQNH